MEDNSELGRSATEWRHMYFIGITQQNLNELSIAQENISGLLSMVGVGPAISSGAPLDAKYIINEKGTTPWLAMYALVVAQQAEALSAIADGKTAIHIPDQFLLNIFKDHINWPENLLSRYDMSLEGYQFFIVPFLIHRDVKTVANLSQSLKAPDGSLEIFNVYEFSEEKPEVLLNNIAELASFIKSNRPDIVDG